MSQEPLSTPPPSPLPSPAPAPQAEKRHPGPVEPVVKMHAPKPLAKVRAPVLYTEARPARSLSSRLMEGVLFAIVAAAIGHLVAQRLFVGEEQVVDRPVGPLAVLMSGDAANPAP